MQLILVQIWMWYFPSRLLAEHGVVGDHLVHLDRLQAQPPGDLVHQFRT